MLADSCAASFFVFFPPTLPSLLGLSFLGIGGVIKARRDGGVVDRVPQGGGGEGKSVCSPSSLVMRWGLIDLSTWSHLALRWASNLFFYRGWRGREWRREYEERQVGLHRQTRTGISYPHSLTHKLISILTPERKPRDCEETKSGGVTLWTHHGPVRLSKPNLSVII